MYVCVEFSFGMWTENRVSTSLLFWFIGATNNGFWFHEKCGQIKRNWTMNIKLSGSLLPNLNRHYVTATHVQRSLFNCSRCCLLFSLRVFFFLLRKFIDFRLCTLVFFVVAVYSSHWIQFVVQKFCSHRINQHLLNKIALKWNNSKPLKYNWAGDCDISRCVCVCVCVSLPILVLFSSLFLSLFVAVLFRCFSLHFIVKYTSWTPSEFSKQPKTKFIHFVGR